MTVQGRAIVYSAASSDCTVKIAFIKLFESLLEPGQRFCIYGLQGFDGFPILAILSDQERSSVQQLLYMNFVVPEPDADALALTLSQRKRRDLPVEQ
jgi:hypothetical protein